MRLALVLVTVVGLSSSLASEAHAFSLELPRLRAPTLSLSADTLLTRDLDAPAPSALFLATTSVVVPPRYSWVLDDARPFWYATGASAVVALGTHVLVGLPVAVFTSMALSPIALAAPAALLPIVLGVGGMYVLAQSALAAGAAAFAFGTTSDIYDGNYLSALAGHVGGAVVGAGVSALTFGFGGLLFGGLGMIAEFTGSAGISGVGVFTLLGALPAVVVGGIALVGVPAIVGAWALVASATAKEGYAIDPRWRQAPPPRAPVAARDSAALPLATIALPAP